MAQIPIIATPTDAEISAYKARSVHAKFMNTLLLGMGGATVYGLVGALAPALIGLVSAPVQAGAAVMFGLSATGLMAAAGLAALAVVGIGCVYMGSRFLSESVFNDQRFLARQTGLATRANAAAVEMEDPHAQTRGAGPQNMALLDDAPEQTNWAEKHPPRMRPEPQQQPRDGNWSERVSAASDEPSLAVANR